MFAYLVLVPLIFHFGSQIPEFAYAGKTYVIAKMDSDAIFGAFVKPIGIGAIAVSGIIGIIRMGKIVAGSISLGFKGLKGGGVEAAPRTQTDMSPRNVLLIQFGSTLLMALLFFVVGMTSHGADRRGLLGGPERLVCGGRRGGGLRPVVPLHSRGRPGHRHRRRQSGLRHDADHRGAHHPGAGGDRSEGHRRDVHRAGRRLRRLHRAVHVRGAHLGFQDRLLDRLHASQPGDLEIRRHHPGVSRGGLCDSRDGFRLPLHGARPRNRRNGLQHEGPARSPGQHDRGGEPRDSSRIAANQPWLLYGLGGFVAIMLYMAGVPMLAFALGIYIPIPINMAVLAGAFVSYIVGKTGGSEKVRKARQDQGILIASGLMAGAAIFGIITAILRQPALGAPIRYISIGEKFSLEHTKTGESFLQSKPADWYEGVSGPGDQPGDVPGPRSRLLLLAKKGAEWFLREEEAAEKESA